ncbi:EcsC family protein [Peribacillus sp. SCS-155]|uniref:EcsC family protein n=1 Tax=Peribacillus sedimenti TaxID=3115297 RepID=UPI003905DEB9
MVLTERESQVLGEIKKWEAKLNSYESTDFTALYDKWLEQAFSLIPEENQRLFFSKLDNSLFHMQALIQGSQYQVDARTGIINTARVFHSDISSIADLRILTIDQLNYLTDQHIAKHRLYSLIQGGASGFGGIFLTGLDLSAIAVINVRVVQLIAMCYGFEVNTPFEMMMALKVFHIGMMPKRMQGAAWNELINETEKSSNEYFYEGKEELTNLSWLEQPFKQILKAAAISSFRKKTIQGMPVISMAIGAAANYNLTRSVSEVAKRYYQYRYLLNKSEELE